MPKLAKIPGKLSIGEVVDRLKKNPNDPDPEVQLAKRSLEDVYKRIAPNINEILSFSQRVVASIQPTLDLYSVFVQQITIPMHFIENISRISENMQQFTEPMQVLADTIAKFQAPLIYPVLQQLDYFPISAPEEYIFGKAILEPQVHINNHRDELFEEQTILLKELVRLHREEPKIKGKSFFFDDESRTFMVKEVKWRALNLSTERGSENMALFFVSMLEFLQAGGQMNGQVFQVPILVSELLEKLKFKGIIEATRDWVKSTKGNLKRTKIIPYKLEKVIIIGEYDDKIDGFYFGIKLPIEELPGV